ncbi:MAG: sulfotransferase [Synechococcus sp.]
MLTTYFHILQACWKIYGVSWTLLQWLIGVPVFLGFTRCTLLLDNLFFPQYRQQPIDNPVFIIGNPRSGTSFLHRLLTQTEEYAAFQTWHLLFPSLTARAFIKPIINWLIRTNRTTIMPEESGHGLYLNGIEHDEFLFLYRLDTQFLLLLSPLAFDDREYPELRFHDRQSSARRHASVKFYKACLQRHLYYTGTSRAIAQAHYSTHRIKTLLDVFPDAKFIYILRSPHETIPSHLSLDRIALQNKAGIEQISPQILKRYYHRRYRYDIDLYRYFHMLNERQEITQRNTKIVQYGELRSSLQTVFDSIIKFADLSPSNRLKALVSDRAESQKHYQRKHRVNQLDEFGLISEQISTDFSFIFDNYDFTIDLVIGFTDKQLKHS